MADLPLREDRIRVPLPGGKGKWSEWKKAMVPNETVDERTGAELTEERGPNQDGYMWSNIDDKLCKVGRLCGIYEFQAKGNPEEGQLESAVVYVGSTCPREEDNRLVCHRLKSRIIRYCRYGNHKDVLINDALSRGYELWVRYKEAGSAVEAQEWENDLLNRYDYAWNVRNNGTIRVILP